MNTNEWNKQLIRVAIELSAEAVRKGFYPYGALLEKDGEIIQVAHNTTKISGGDVTAHAELVLIREASQKLDANVLKACALYTSTEPCAMCAGAIYWAGIKKVFFGCCAKREAEISGEPFAIPASDIFAWGAHTTELFGPILEHEAENVLIPFWRNLRSL